MLVLFLLLAGELLSDQERPSVAVQEKFAARIEALATSPTEEGGDPTEFRARFARALTQGASHAFVSNDGSAVAIWTGRLDKYDVHSQKVLSTHERYRLGVKGNLLVAFNISQEAYVRGSDRGWRDIDLRPVVLLDKHRTFCVNLTSPATGMLYFALIDDRQRGERPNRVATIQSKGASMPSGVSVISGTQKSVNLRVPHDGGTEFVEVDLGTLAVRRIKTPAWKGFSQDIALIERLDPEQMFVAHSQARWNGKSYFIATRHVPGEPNPGPACFAWDGKSLERTEPWTVVATSGNSTYGWLLNRKTGSSWVITQR